MQRKIKKICLLALGWGFIILGVAGLFLPVLQGILFLLIGLIILSSEYPWAHKVLETLKNRFPTFTRRSTEASRKVSEWFSNLTGSAGKHNVIDPPKVVGASAAGPDGLRCVAKAGFHPIGPGSTVASAKADDPDLRSRKQGATDVAMPALKSKIMIALRDPEHVDNLMKVACQFSNGVEADVVAIYVAEVGPGLPLDLELPMLDDPGRKVLSCAIEVALQNDKEISTHLIRAHHAGEAIVTQARSEWVDLLIMGYRAKRGLREILLGSTFRYVIEHAPCQVVVEILPQEAAIPCR